MKRKKVQYGLLLSVLILPVWLAGQIHNSFSKTDLAPVVSDYKVESPVLQDGATLRGIIVEEDETPIEPNATNDVDKNANSVISGEGMLVLMWLSIAYGIRFRMRN